MYFFFTDTYINAYNLRDREKQREREYFKEVTLVFNGFMIEENKGEIAYQLQMASRQTLNGNGREPEEQ